MALTISDLRTGYVRGQTVLDGVSLTLERGEVLGVLGRNGAGKTTLARSIMGLLATWSGRVLVDEHALPRGGSARQRIQHGVCLVPENRQVFGTLTVHENLRLAASVRGRKASDFGTVEGLFPVLRERRHQLAAGLSGGQQQMLAIARALVLEPDYLIVDEPSLGLAASVVDAITDIFRSIAKQGVGILLVEQNVGMVEALCESALVLHGDGAGEVARLTDTSARHLIEASYLGQAKQKGDQVPLAAQDIRLGEGQL
ncbi:ABC transporter ATP-binding protein [Nocardioides terrisoli]|uniref:ABC transporter ATP-binding protein n=1 Tax=Nocardioides terrisoli TaxID=3388267 RepID=UPI00287B8374|nr:ATP-binding cassette domain-containing protein [Nocardioides marmorisolisilvae]